MHKKYIITSSLGALALSLSLLAGCNSDTAARNIAPPKVLATTLSVEDTVSNRSGSAIWATTCSRCHNSRSPSEYTDAQWDTIMMHMRIQCRLTASDAQAVLDFLKSAN